MPRPAPRCRAPRRRSCRRSAGRDPPAPARRAPACAAPVTSLIGAFSALKALSAASAAIVGRHAAARVRFVDHDQPAGALDALQDGVLVERRGGARVDDVAADLLPGQRVGGSIDCPTIRPSATMVASSPSRSTLASPKGMVVGALGHVLLDVRRASCARRTSPGRRHGSTGSTAPWPRRATRARRIEARDVGV